MPRNLRKETVRASLLAVALGALSASAWSQETGGPDPAVLEQGKELFTTTAEPQCAVCHTLADAEAVGEVGPNLDELKPTVEKVRLAVEDGVGSMPAYGDLLSEEQIEAIAQYVAAVAVGQ